RSTCTARGSLSSVGMSPCWKSHPVHVTGSPANALPSVGPLGLVASILGTIRIGVSLDECVTGRNDRPTAIVFVTRTRALHVPGRRAASLSASAGVAETRSPVATTAQLL